MVDVTNWILGESSNPTGVRLRRIDFKNGYRWGQPGQQHGLRMPLRILSTPARMRRWRVSAFFAEVTQQIHSLRANGVISSQTRLAIESHAIAFRKSAGIL